MASERDVHLLLSPKAAKILDQRLDDPKYEFEDEVEASIIGAIRADIAVQLPARGGKVKKKKRA